MVVTAKEYGPLFLVGVLYGYVLAWSGSVVLFWAALRRSSLFRWQAVLLLAGALLPLVSHVAYMIGIRVFGIYDPAPLSFGVGSALLFAGMGRLHLGEVLPVPYDLVLRNIEDGVIVVDLESRVVEINASAERLLAVHEADVIGRRAADVLPNRIAEAIQSDKAFNLNTPVTLNDDTIYSLHTRPFHDRSGGLSGRLVLVRDITVRERLITELNAYAHTVAHDLKNPIQMILGHLSLVAMDIQDSVLQDSDRIVENVDRALTTAERMNTIVDALLLLSSVRDMKAVNITALDVEEILAEVLRQLAPTIKEAGAVVNCSPNWPHAMGYGPWVEQVLINYVSNGVKYGGSPPELHVGANAEDGMVRFWVRDNGQGLTPEQQESVFSEFERLDRLDISGHGLGLSIARRIVRRLGGEVGVESKPGEGCVFFFTLPAA